VDSGYGRAIKRLIGVKLAAWLENEANLEKWETGKLTASERRILLTIWVFISFLLLSFRMNSALNSGVYWMLGIWYC
jgi:hypothetical protein